LLGQEELGISAREEGLRDQLSNLTPRAAVISASRLAEAQAAAKEWKTSWTPRLR